MHSPNDFDFLMGEWDVRHRKLATRLKGADDWMEFVGTTKVWPLLAGQANIDDNVLEDPNGAYRAASLRSFDSKSGLWSIWWLDGRSADKLEVPVTGRFEGDRGEFIAKELWQGKELLTRFVWLKKSELGPRWEQAMSVDGGSNWETNWSMDFKRRG